MRPPVHLQHLHLPNPIPYTHSLTLQSRLLSRHWNYRDTLKGSSTPPSPSSPHDADNHPPPPPALLTFTSHPIYTVGRRHLTLHPLSAAQQAFLTGATSVNNNTSSTNSTPPAKPTPTSHEKGSLADFQAVARGGLLTFHGPGQLTAYPVVDLRRHNLGARRYVRMLEDMVVRTCKRLGVERVGVDCMGGNPGVWIMEEEEVNGGGKEKTSDRKVCAVGVRVERGVGSWGVGLNVFDREIEEGERGRYLDEDGKRAKGYLSWGFGRIVACGLEGKESTWLSREGLTEDVSLGNGLEEVARVLAEELVVGLNKGGGKEDVLGIERVREEDVMKLPES